MAKLIFLPGAVGSADFWRPAADRLRPGRAMRFLAWPGLGEEPGRPEVQGLDDLVAMTLAELSEPADLVAQSMGGLVAIKAALAAPDKVRRLVLTATSGGVPVEDLGGADWRDDYRRDFPRAAAWITELREDLSAQIPQVRAPTLLIWGDRDPISPTGVGMRLQALLPDATLRIVEGGGHDLARSHAAEVAAMLDAHLA
jgi:pimeloyl-ACP methyl ester carboxylesterase